MIDRRELILSRLFALLGQVPNVVGAYRNRGELPDTNKTPAVILLDGTETLHTHIGGKSLVQMPPAVITLLPQIFIILPICDDITNTTINGVSNPVGPTLNTFRVSVLKLLLNDDTLIAMVGPEGQIEYKGCDTDLQTGSTIGALGAHMQINLAISYSLNPTDLQ